MSVALFPLLFTRANIAANLSAVALATADGGDGYTMPFEGDVVGISVRLNASRTNGTLSLSSLKNGAIPSGGPTNDIDATVTQQDHHAIEHGVVSFEAGDRLGIQIDTDSSWAPSTADGTFVLWVTAGHHQIG